jgi:hypothetical protein
MYVRLISTMFLANISMAADDIAKFLPGHSLYHIRFFCLSFYQYLRRHCHFLELLPSGGARNNSSDDIRPFK